MTVSATLVAAAFAQDTGEAVLELLTIEHADLAAAIRVVNNTESVTSNGNTFTPYPFRVTLPDDKGDSAPRGRIEIDNVSREIAQAIRNISSAPDITISLILASDPDTIERSFTSFKMRNVKWDTSKVSGDLTIEDFTSEPYPAGEFVPSKWPGIF